MSTFAENLKQIRLTKGYSQLDLALALGLTDKAVSAWENGRTVPKMGTIEMIAMTLGCKKSDLIGDRVESVPEIDIDRDHRRLQKITTSGPQLESLIEYWRVLPEAHRNRLIAYATALYDTENSVE